MKILVIQPWIRAGGAETLTIHLAYNLQNLGHRVTIITLFVDFIGIPSIYKSLRFITPFRYISKLCKQKLFFRWFFGFWLLLYLGFREGKTADLLNPHNFPTHWIASIVSLIFRKPVVWTCNEPPTKVLWREARKIGLQEFFGSVISTSFVDKILVKKVKYIIVLDRKNQIRIKTRYGRKSIIIHSGVDFNFYSCNKIEENVFEKYDLENRFILLTVGRLTLQKNQLMCIKCLRIVLDRIKEAFLIIVGSGPMEGELKQLARELNIDSYIKFTGFISNEELRALYYICDINLFPAIKQSWGLTPFEALCAKKISIISNDCGAAEILSKEGFGVVCEPTPEKFAENVIRIYNNQDYYRNIAQKGFEYVKENISWQQYAKKVSSVFLKSVKKI